MVIQYKVATPETHTNNQNGLSGLYLYIQVVFVYISVCNTNNKRKRGYKDPKREGSWVSLDEGHLEWA